MDRNNTRLASFALGAASGAFYGYRWANGRLMDVPVAIMTAGAVKGVAAVLLLEKTWNSFRNIRQRNHQLYRL